MEVTDKNKEISNADFVAIVHAIADAKTIKIQNQMQVFDGSKNYTLGNVRDYFSKVSQPDNSSKAAMGSTEIVALLNNADTSIISKNDTNTPLSNRKRLHGFLGSFAEEYSQCLQRSGTMGIAIDDASHTVTSHCVYPHLPQKPLSGPRLPSI